ncbi:MAG TPA: FmdB family zinc ribbon protein [Gemmatimonadaceae bacterium]|jgi:putative FmdB family regulatory protein|nr:FmdB family zinc ribbon protein [Gemmatimonadaceae bacterium]
MPTYEFRCPNGHDFEKFYRSISAAPREVACPTCGVIAERQLSGGAGLVFKGSGFYITDYGKDGKKAQSAPPGGGKSEPSASEPRSNTESKSSSEPKASENKPAAKPESKPSGKSKSGE